MVKRGGCINPDNRDPLYDPLPFVFQHFRNFRREIQRASTLEKGKFCKQWTIITATRLNDYRFRPLLKSAVETRLSEKRCPFFSPPPPFSFFISRFISEINQGK